MQQATYICVVLDASSSMDHIKKETKKSFHTFLDKQRQEPEKTIFDLYQFSDETTRLIHAVDLSIWKDDPLKHYQCDGCTAMNDAICIAIDTLGKDLATMPEPERPDHVLVVIITDGEENSSRTYTTADVKTRIQHQKDKYSWDFIFLGANLDAVQEGAELGITADQCVQFEASEAGMVAFAPLMSEPIRNARERARKRRQQ